MKIKKACELTGLSEKAVRLYVNEGLVTPVIEEGVSYKSYSFSEENIEELKTIAVLRGAGFSINDIRIMNDSPEKIHTLITQRQQSLEDELETKIDLTTNLSRLASYEQSDINTLAQAIEPSVSHRGHRNKPKSKRNYKFIIGFFLVIIAAILYIELTTPISLELIGSLCLIILGVLCVFYFFHCLRLPKRAAEFDYKTVGTIIDIVEDHGFDISFARGGSTQATSSENGIGGMWQFFFLLWNEIRPDCFYPLVGFYNNGKYVLTQLPFGWLKNTWSPEEKIEIAWNKDDIDYVLPLTGRWIKLKAFAYLLVGILALAVSMWILSGVEL